MGSEPPALVAIEQDDYHAQHVGRTADGCQFFLTQPFIPASDINAGREFIALYLFNPQGQLVESYIDDLGPRANVDLRTAAAIQLQRLAQLGPVTNERIEIQPFQVERFGTIFGLIPRIPEDDDVMAVEIQPGNYMAFFEPFDSGEYDT